jgi:hypothetical protein
MPGLRQIPGKAVAFLRRRKAPAPPRTDALQRATKGTMQVATRALQVAGLLPRRAAPARMFNPNLLDHLHLPLSRHREC